MLSLSALLTFGLSLTSLVTAADTAAWKSRSIYFALTDRFGRSDSSTTPCGNLQDYCGGTFQGLQSKLDYIQGLGFDSIWITPVVANSPGGYHGYWAQDLYSINPNYGTAQDLKNLVNAAHAKGMYVMVDVVANHMGKGAIANNLPAPLNQASSYHSTCQIPSQDPISEFVMENCRIDNLPDINTEDPTIINVLNTWVAWLVKEYSFDGVRIDTVKHIDKDFWPGFVSSIPTYSIGEVWNGDPAYLLPYAKLMPLVDYATYYPMDRFYMNGTSPTELTTMMDTIKNTFPDPSALGTFLDNHDNPRWLNWPQASQTKLKNALAFVLLSRGIPILYYGTEQGYTGGKDPLNREDLWRSGYNTNTVLYQAIKKMMAAKKAAGGLADNDHVHLYSPNMAYAFSRANGNLIVLTNNVGAGYNAQHCFNSQKPNGRWKDVYGNAGSVLADNNGQICVSISNGEPVVLLADAGVEATPRPTPTTLRTSTVGAAPTTGNTACPTAVAVTFTQRITTVPGDVIKIVGSTAQLGSWNVGKAPALSATGYTSSNPVWSTTLSMPAKSAIQFKFVKVSSSGVVTWENDPNRSFTVPACQASAASSTSWQ